MIDNPVVLLVDDDILQHELTRDILQDQYQVLIASSGNEGVTLASSSRPAVILMDILMEDMNGYEACRRIRAEPDCADVPIIFLSGLTEPEDRLRAYEAGGNDFLAKPFTADALLEKVASLVALEKQRQALAASAQSAFQVAMTAMTSASEQGLVMGYVGKTYRCDGYEELARATLDVSASFGLTAAVQFRGAQEVWSWSARGPSSPLEASVLSNLKSCGRIVNFGTRYAFNYEHATLLISDMPVDDDERCGRLRDHLVSVAESADARVCAIDTQLALLDQQQKMFEVLGRVRELLAQIESRSRSQREQSAEVLQTMLNRMEDAFVYLGLTEAQESAVAGTLHRAVKDTLQSFEPDAREGVVAAQLLADMALMARGPGSA